ncbi:hypothetical protein MGE_05329, partial [Candida albicans P75010]
MFPFLDIQFKCKRTHVVQSSSNTNHWEDLLLLYDSNTFATTTMISYGTFFLSYGALYIPSFGIMKAYA